MNRIEKLTYFLSLNPADVFSRYALALELKSIGSFDNAVQELKKCLEFDNSHLASLYQLCDIAVLTRNNELFQQFINIAKQTATSANDTKTYNELLFLEDDFTI